MNLTRAELRELRENGAIDNKQFFSMIKNLVAAGTSESESESVESDPIVDLTKVIEKIGSSLVAKKPEQQVDLVPILAGIQSQLSKLAEATLAATKERQKSKEFTPIYLDGRIQKIIVQ